MKLFVCVVVLCALLTRAPAVNIDAGEIRYDCRRSTNSCGNGRCSTQNGLCNCGSFQQQLKGLDCSIPANYNPTSAPQCNCQQGSTCYTNGFGDFRCACAPGWTGTDCSICRVSLQCNINSMSVVVMPQNLPFNGFLDFSDSTGRILNSCRQTVTFSSAWNGNQFTMQLGTDGFSPSLCPAAREARANNVNCYTVQLGYNPAIRTHLDETFVFCCNQNGIVNPTVSGGVTVNTLNQVSPVLLSDSITTVQGRFVFTSNNLPISGGAPVSIGQDISFFMERQVGIPDFRVTNCLIANPGGADIPIIDNTGCPVRSSYSIFKNIRKETNGIYIDMEAFGLQSATQVVMTCQMTTCGGNTCSLSTCASDNNFQNIGRRRRQADRNETVETAETSASFRINLSIKDDCPAQTKCTLHDVFLPVAVVFGVLLLAAIIVAVFLCAKMWKSSKRENIAMASPPAYHNSALKA